MNSESRVEMERLYKTAYDFFDNGVEDIPEDLFQRYAYVNFMRDIRYYDPVFFAL